MPPSAFVWDKQRGPRVGRALGSRCLQTLQGSAGAGGASELSQERCREKAGIPPSRPSLTVRPAISGCFLKLLVILAL